MKGRFDLAGADRQVIDPVRKSRLDHPPSRFLIGEQLERRLGCVLSRGAVSLRRDGRDDGRERFADFRDARTGRERRLKPPKAFGILLRLARHLGDGDGGRARRGSRNGRRRRAL